MAEVDVCVDVFSIITMRLRMTAHDTVGDMKHLIHEATGIPVERIDIRHAGKKAIAVSRDDMEIKEVMFGFLGRESFQHGAKFMMVSQANEDFQKVNELKSESQSLKDNHFKIHHLNVVPLHIYKSFFSLASHELFPTVASGSSTEPTGSSTEPSSSGHHETLRRLHEKIASLEAEIKEKKLGIKELTQQVRDVPIPIQLRQPSGNLISITIAPNLTVLQAKRTVIAPAIGIFAEDVSLVSGNELMRDGKRLYSYKVEEGTILDCIKMNRRAPEAEPEVAQSADDVSGNEIERLLHGGNVFEREEVHEGDKIHRECHEDTVKIKCIIKDNAKITLNFNPFRVRVQAICDEIADLTEIASDAIVLTGIHSKQVWNKDRALAFVPRQDGYQAYMTYGGLKGGGLRRPPVRKEDAMKLVKKKIEKSYKDDTLDTVAPPSDLPQTFQTFVEEHTMNFNQTLLMKTTIGSTFVASCLRTLPVDKLKILETIFKPASGTKKLTNEEKVVSSLEVIVPSMATLAKCQVKLTELQNDATVKMLHLFLEEFHTFNEQSGMLMMDGAGFLAKIGREIKDREERLTDANVEAVANTCQLM